MMPASRARRASSGPARASAATLTMTMSLRYSQHSRVWEMPSAGSALASMTISTSASAMTCSASSQQKTLPLRAASWMLAAPSAAAGQPLRVSAARAREALSSATATRRMPGVRCTWLKNMELNFPAPIKATFSGFLSASRCLSRRCRFMGHLVLAGAPWRGCAKSIAPIGCHEELSCRPGRGRRPGRCASSARSGAGGRFPGGYRGRHR